MVRTKADGASGSSRKAVGGSAPRKALGGASTSSASSSSPSAKGNKYGGGNPYCPRPTPDWQKGIGSFLSPGKSRDKENTMPDAVEIEGSDDNCQAGSSTSSSQPSSSQGSSKSSSDDD